MWDVNSPDLVIFQWLILSFSLRVYLHLINTPWSPPRSRESVPGGTAANTVDAVSFCFESCPVCSCFTIMVVHMLEINLNSLRNRIKNVHIFLLWNHSFSLSSLTNISAFLSQCGPARCSFRMTSTPAGPFDSSPLKLLIDDDLWIKTWFFSWF